MKGNPFELEPIGFQTLLEPSVDEWLTWAYEFNVHPGVLYTLEQYPELFRDESKNLYPRKWSTLGNILDQYGGDFIFGDHQKLQELFSEDVIKIIRECYQKGR